MALHLSPWHGVLGKSTGFDRLGLLVVCEQGKDGKGKVYSMQVYADGRWPKQVTNSKAVECEILCKPKGDTLSLAIQPHAKRQIRLLTVKPQVNLFLH